MKTPGIPQCEEGAGVINDWYTGLSCTDLFMPCAVLVQGLRLKHKGSLLSFLLLGF